jgi:hypothetical protein
MIRLAAAGSAALVAVLLTEMLATPAVATAASNSATTSIPTDAGIIEMHVTATCEGTNCTWSTAADLLTPDGPTGFPGDLWARQTITLRGSDRNVWQEANFSAPSGNPTDTKGENHENVLSKLYKEPSSTEISVTYFGGGPLERFKTDGNSQPIDWATGQPATKATFYACSQIQVVYGGVNLTTPTACASTTFG